MNEIKIRIRPAADQEYPLTEYFSNSEKETDDYPNNLPVKRPFAMLCGVAGTLYALWMIYAAGLTYLLMAFCFLVVGIPVYIRACAQARADATDPEQKEKPSFTPTEAVCAIIMVVVAIIAIVLAATGKLKL